MIIDILFAVCMLLAIFKGVTKGLVLGLFSLVAFIIGLAAALKLSVAVAAMAENKFGGGHKLLPVISFAIVFMAVILLVSFTGKFIKKVIQIAMLGWLDALLGIILFVTIYTIIFSIFLFYAEKIMLVKPHTIAASQIYPYVSPVGPKVIDNLGKIIPIFKNMFAELEQFFSAVAEKHIK